MFTTTYVEKRISGKTQAVTKVDSRFRKYKPEERKEVREIKVTHDQMRMQLIDAWKRFIFSFGSDTYTNSHEYYNAAVRVVTKLTAYTAKDVEKFVLTATEFQDVRFFPTFLGVFLSALINLGKDSEYVIHTHHLQTPPWLLGFKNSKLITVEGDLGVDGGIDMKNGRLAVNGNVRSVGLSMKNGIIIVNGNSTGDDCFLMKGGTVLIRGNSGVLTGQRLDDGVLIVKGNVGRLVGNAMNGGVIHLLGDYESIGGVQHGKIYHKGKLIVDK